MRTQSTVTRVCFQLQFLAELASHSREAPILAQVCDVRRILCHRHQSCGLVYSLGVPAHHCFYTRYFPQETHCAAKQSCPEWTIHSSEPISALDAFTAFPGCCIDTSLLCYHCAGSRAVSQASGAHFKIPSLRLSRSAPQVCPLGDYEPECAWKVRKLMARH